MARLMSWGNELQSISVGMEWVTSVNGSPVIETSIKRSGNAAIRLNNTSAAENIQHVYRSTQGVSYIRAYFYLVAGSTNDGIGFISVANSSNRKVGLRLGNTASNNVLHFYNDEDGVQIGSNSPSISTGVWYRLEYKFDSTTLSATTCEARLYAASDEATLLWNPSGTIDITANPDRFVLGQIGSEATLDIIWDDIAINDGSGSFENSWCGEGEIVVLRPSATGDNNAWTRGGTDSGANWSQEEEIPPDDATERAYTQRAQTAAEKAGRPPGGV